MLHTPIAYNVICIPQAVVEIPHKNAAVVYRLSRYTQAIPSHPNIITSSQLMPARYHATSPGIVVPFKILTLPHPLHSHLQEILSSPLPPRRHSPAMIRHRTEDFEIWIEILAKRHDTRHVAASVAVIGSRPDSHDVLGLEMVFVALVDELVGACDEREAIDVIELEYVSARRDRWKGTGRKERTSDETLSPNNHPAPLGLTAHVSTSSGSDQTRSQNAPSWGISCARATTRIWSRVLISGDKPPCTQSTLPSIMAARARKSKT